MVDRSSYIVFRYSVGVRQARGRLGGMRSPAARAGRGNCRGYFFAAASLFVEAVAFLPAALPPFGFFAPPLLPGPLSGMV